MALPGATGTGRGQLVAGGSGPGSPATVCGPDNAATSAARGRGRGTIEPPRTYYAAIVMDGDHMGKWLSGEKAPALRDVYHPRLVTAFEQLASTDSTEMQYGTRLRSVR